MPSSTRGTRVTKSHVMNLLDQQAQVNADDMACTAETVAVLLCYSSRTGTEGAGDSGGCAAEELALRRCEMRMENRSVDKVKKDMKRSLIFQILRLANFKKVIK